MIRVEAGNDLGALQTRPGEWADRGPLDAAVPLFDMDSGLWRPVRPAARPRWRGRLLTRPAADQLHSGRFGEPARVVVQVIHCPRIQAKSVISYDRGGPLSMDWIGSQDFKKSSACTVHHPVVVFRGTRPLGPACWNRP
jgi:hypothetical protein